MVKSLEVVVDSVLEKQIKWATELFIVEDVPYLDLADLST